MVRESLSNEPVEVTGQATSLSEIPNIGSIETYRDDLLSPESHHCLDSRIRFQDVVCDMPERCHVGTHRFLHPLHDWIHQSAIATRLARDGIFCRQVAESIVHEVHRYGGRFWCRSAVTGQLEVVTVGTAILWVIHWMQKEAEAHLQRVVAE